MPSWQPSSNASPWYAIPSLPGLLQQQGTGPVQTCKEMEIIYRTLQIPQPMKEPCAMTRRCEFREGEQQAQSLTADHRAGMI